MPKETFSIRLTRDEVLALHATLRTLSVPVDKYAEIMGAYRKIEVAANEAAKGN